MPATICDKSRKELETRVDESGQTLAGVLAELAESLGTHGFNGRLKLDLTVEVDHDTYGEGHVVLERGIKLAFRR